MSTGGQRLWGAALTWGMRWMAGQFLRESNQARRVAKNTLRAILEANGSTEWGRVHGLNGSSALDNFRQMPVTTYKDYEPYVERIANGEPNILTAEPVTYFAVSSGTTGPQKMIPVTRSQTRAIMKTMLTPLGLAIKEGLLEPMRGPWLQIMTEQINGVTPGGIPKGAATSGGMDKMEPMFKRIWTSPMPVVRIKDQVAARYLHLLFALREERLWTIVSFFPSTLLFVLRDLQARSEELLRDLADGTITSSLELDSGLRAELTRRLGRNPERARVLSKLRDQGRFTTRDIWPQAGAVLTAGSGTFRFYVDQLRPYLGGMPVFSSVYSSSEGTIGIGLSHKEPGYLLAPSAAYHEFLPLAEADDPDARPLAMDQVEPGALYEVVMTTYAGLTRYRLGDVVKVLGFHGEAPILEFIERRGQVINVVGEKTSEAQIAGAFEAACRQLGASVTDYVVTNDAGYTPARYLLLLEELKPGAVDLQVLLETFEAHLEERAASYHTNRRMGKLGPMAVVVLRPGAFERYRERRVAAGASAAQVKVPHVVPDPRVAAKEFFGEEEERLELRYGEK